MALVAVKLHENASNTIALMLTMIVPLPTMPLTFLHPPTPPVPLRPPGVGLSLCLLL